MTRLTFLRYSSCLAPRCPVKILIVIALKHVAARVMYRCSCQRKWGSCSALHGLTKVVDKFDNNFGDGQLARRTRDQHWDHRSSVGGHTCFGNRSGSPIWRCGLGRNEHIETDQRRRTVSGLQLKGDDCQQCDKTLTICLTRHWDQPTSLS